MTSLHRGKPRPKDKDRCPKKTYHRNVEGSPPGLCVPYLARSRPPCRILKKGVETSGVRDLTRQHVSPPLPTGTVTWTPSRRYSVRASINSGPFSPLKHSSFLRRPPFSLNCIALFLESHISSERAAISNPLLYTKFLHNPKMDSLCYKASHVFKIRLV